MSETLDFGSDDTRGRRMRQRAAMAGAATLMAVILTEKPAGAPEADGNRVTQPDASSSVSFTFDPHHQAVDFTPMGAIMVTASRTVNPVGVSFENLHCRQGVVWGGIFISAGRVSYHISDTVLPPNSLVLDCLLDNELNADMLTTITVAGNSYPYSIED